MMDDRVVHRRDAWEDRQLVLMNELQDIMDLEFRQKVKGACGGDRQIHQHGHAENMKEGESGQIAFGRFLLALQPQTALDRIGDQVVMRQHAALRRARRPSGVLQQREIALGVHLAEERNAACALQQLLHPQHARSVSDAEVAAVSARQDRIKQIFRKGQIVLNGGYDDIFE